MGNHGGRQHAQTIIGEQERVKLRGQLGQGFQQATFHGRGKGCIRLPVDAYNLLRHRVVGNARDAGFGARRATLILHQPAGVNAVALQGVHQQGAIVIFARHAHDCGAFGVQLGDVMRRVARRTQDNIRPLVLQNQHGGLTGQAVGVAVDHLVDDHIAHHQHPALAEFGNNRTQRLFHCIHHTLKRRRGKAGGLNARIRFFQLAFNGLNLSADCLHVFHAG